MISEVKRDSLDHADGQIVVERANPVQEQGEFSEEVEDMLERTRKNPKPEPP